MKGKHKRSRLVAVMMKHGARPLLEYAAAKHGRVDKANGVIYDVKVCGLESKNIGKTIGLDPDKFGKAVDQPYAYAHGALQNALGMYEGAVVKMNHPESTINKDGKRIVKRKSRSVLETVGELRNARMKPDGVYANFHVLKTGKHAPFIFETAERMPDKLAFSHNAWGVPALKDGRAVINEILEVYSVDLVGDRPATTNGLFENVPPPRRKVRVSKMAKRTRTDEELTATLMEQLKGDANGGGQRPMKTASACPEDDMGGGDEGETDVTEEDDSSIRDAVTAICNDDTIDDIDDLRAQILALFTVSDDDQVVEDYLQLKGEREARQVLESARVKITESRIQAVRRAKGVKRTQLIESMAQNDNKLIRPRRSFALLENQAGGTMLRGEELVKALLR